MDKRIIILMVIFLLGSASLFAYRLSLKPPAEALASVSRDVKVGQPASCSDGTPEAYRWKWDFGDGEYSVAQNPTHIYEEARDYTVKVTSYGSLGVCTKVLPVAVGNTVQQAESSRTAATSEAKAAPSPQPKPGSPTRKNHPPIILGNQGEGNDPGGNQGPPTNDHGGVQKK